MNNKYLACQIVEETSSHRVVTGKLMDGSSFSIRVPYWDVVAAKDSPIRAGWLLVELLGEDLENNKSTVKLSAPDMKLGHNICVSNKDLRRVVDIQGDA